MATVPHKQDTDLSMVEWNARSIISGDTTGIRNVHSATRYHIKYIPETSHKHNENSNMTMAFARHNGQFSSIHGVSGPNSTFSTQRIERSNPITVKIWLQSDS